MTAASPPAPTLRALLARAELRLRPAGAGAGDASLDAPVRWVHSTDLLDPTPFLSEDVVLLTTGTQFTGPDETVAEDAVFDDYVERLRLRGVLGLGFGTEVVRDGIPPQLQRACAARSMPLFEVPYQTPFIAIARANAEAIAARAYARRSWALAAQRALALAALRPDGFDATLAELARQLGGWVGMYDASGTLTHAHPTPALDPRVRGGIDAEAANLVRRGGGAGSSLRIAGAPVTLQTIGASGRRGVLAVAGVDLDQDARGVVTAVVATTGLALEQRRLTSDAWSRLRTGLTALIADGRLDLVRAVALSAWGAFPDPPLIVAVADAAAPPGAREMLDTYAEHGRLYYGRDEDGVLMIAAAGDRGLFDEIAARLQWRVGVSDPIGSDTEIAGARDAARLARDRGQPGVALDIGDAPGDLLSDLATTSARARATAELSSLRAHDLAHGTELERTLSVWLEHDGAHEATARALGIHRHTVRARIALAQRVLGRDLSGFADRAGVWTALRLAGYGEPPLS